jgi:hypothetical protein
MKMMAEIWIGGDIPAALVSELCDLIEAEELLLPDAPECEGFTESGDHLMAARSALDYTLHLQCNHAEWGKFESLEAFLRDHDIPYSRQTHYPIGPYPRMMTHWRPDMALPVGWPLDAEGNAMCAPQGNITEAIKWIDNAAERLESQPISANSDLAHAKIMLEDMLSLQVEPLPVLTIVPSDPLPLPAPVVVIEVSRGQVSQVYCDNPTVVVRVVDWDVRGYGTPPYATEPDRRLLSSALSELQSAVKASL